jgi:hypothetical protein
MKTNPTDLSGKTLFTTGQNYRGTIILHDGKLPGPCCIMCEGKEIRFASMELAKQFVDAQGNDLSEQGYESGMDTRRSLGQ